MLVHFDEVCNGYDSYSMLKSGYTMHNEYLPLFAKSTGDFRETVYHYFDMPFIGLFGLNEISLKLPAILFSIISAVFIYFIVKDIVKKKNIAIISSLLFLFNPSILVFGTMAFRLNIYLNFFIISLFGIVRFYYRKKAKYMLIFALFLSLSLWTYFSARAFIPLYALLVLIIFRKELLKKRLMFIVSLGIFSIVFVFLLQYWLSPMGMGRANSELKLDLFHLIFNYLSYFNPLKLFFGWHNQGILYNLPYIGNFYWWEFITVSYGIFYIIKEKLYKVKVFKLLLLLFLIYPIPANLTGNIGDLFMQRAVVGVAIFVIFSSLGINYILKNFNLKKVVYSFLIFSFIISLYIRFNIYEKSFKSVYFNYGVKDVLSIANQSKYGEVLIDDRNYFWHFFILFYNKVPHYQLEKSPIVYNLDKTKSLSPFYGIKVGKFRFINIRRLPQNIKSNTLLIVKGDINVTNNSSFKVVKKIIKKNENKKVVVYSLLSYLGKN